MRKVHSRKRWQLADDESYNSGDADWGALLGAVACLKTLEI
jgi:hypothetical protein